MVAPIQYSNPRFTPDLCVADPKKVRKFANEMEKADDKAPLAYGKEAMIVAAYAVAIIVAGIIGCLTGAGIAFGVTLIGIGLLGLGYAAYKGYKKDGVAEIKGRAKESVITEQLRKWQESTRPAATAGSLNFYA